MKDFMKINKITIALLITASLQATNWFKTTEVKTSELGSKVVADLQPVKEKAKEELKKAKGWLETAKNKTEEIASNLKAKIMPTKKPKIEENIPSNKLNKTGTDTKSNIKTVTEPIETKNGLKTVQVKEIKTETSNQAAENNVPIEDTKKLQNKSLTKAKL